jgi:hypothetical protein
VEGAFSAPPSLMDMSEYPLRWFSYSDDKEETVDDKEETSLSVSTKL